MKIKLRHKEAKHKTWVKVLKEAWQCKTVQEGKAWLEKEALLLRKRNPGYTLAGAKFIIRMNLGALACKYGEVTEKRIKKLFGVVSPLFGKERYEL